MEIVREQRSLVLDKKSITKGTIYGADVYSGKFYPINQDTIDWLAKMEEMFAGKTQLFVEYGRRGPAPSHLQGKGVAEWFIRTLEEKIGLYIYRPIFKDTGGDKIYYQMDFKPSGPLANVVETIIKDSSQTLILSAKGHSQHNKIETGYEEVFTQFFGFQILHNHDLAVPMSPEQLDTFLIKKIKNGSMSGSHSGIRVGIDAQGNQFGYSPDYKEYKGETPYTIKSNYDPKTAVKVLSWRYPVLKDFILFDEKGNPIPVKQPTEGNAMSADQIPETAIEALRNGPVVIEQRIIAPLEKEPLDDVGKVLLINAAAGNQPPAPDQLEAQIMRQTRVDLGECLELLEAVATGDVVELRDALSDKRVTLNGFATILPFSLSKDFDQTCENLYTRFDHNKNDAALTQQKYAKIGVPTVIEKNTIADYVDAKTGEERVFFVNKVAEDTDGTDGEFYPKGKFLKSVNFKKDDFTDNGDVALSSGPFAAYDRWEAIRNMLTGFIDKMDEKCAVKESL